MNIYCVAHWKYFDKAVPEKALFKLVNCPPICWEWECVVPSIRYEDLISGKELKQKYLENAENVRSVAIRQK